jgi:rod shape-determining protein MreD
MLNAIPINIFRLALLLMLQVLVLSNLGLSTFITPNIFPLFVLLLPFSTPRWLLIIISFLAGLSLDVLLGSIGMNAAACLLIGYLRPFLISLITPKGTEFESNPNVYAQGFTWFLIYLTTSVLIHHSLYLLIESGTFYNLLLLSGRILASTVFSITLMFMLLYLFSANKKRRV